MFGFEKPPWHYLPDTGAVVKAIQSLPQARHRFNDGNLPTGSQLMVRYEVADDKSFRWARVQSWADERGRLRQGRSGPANGAWGRPYEPSRLGY